MTIKINVEHEPRTAVQRLDRASCLRVEGHPVTQAHSLDSFIPDQWLCWSLQCLCPQLAATPCWPLSRESSCHTLMAVCSVASPSAFLIVPLSELSLFSLDTVVWVLPTWRHHCLLEAATTVLTTMYSAGFPSVYVFDTGFPAGPQIP